MADLFNSGFHLQDLLQGTPLLLKGLGMTLLISGISIPLGLLLGTLLGTLRHQGQTPFRQLATGYIEFIRSIPLILLLVFIHYGVFPLLHLRPDFLASSLLSFCLFEGAYFAEILRGGLRSIQAGEQEAAISLGLSTLQQLIFIQLPLAFQRTLPAMMNQVVTLIKDTSLASIVGVIEWTRAGEILYEQTHHDFEILALQACVYFAICFSLSRWSRRFESRLAPAENLYLESIES